MKKVLNIILAFSLMFQLFAPSALALSDTLTSETELNNSSVLDEDYNYQNIVNTKETIPETVELDGDKNELNVPESYSINDYVPTGNLEVDIQFVLPIQNVENPNMGMILKDNNGHQNKIDFNGVTTMDHTLHYTLGAQMGTVAIRKMDQTGSVMNGIGEEFVKYYSVTIYHLQKGTYSIELYGDGYKTYTVENITLDDFGKRVTITNEKGSFEVGDVNGDSKVDTKDLESLESAMGTTEEDVIRTHDLNRDKKVDIIDVAMLSSCLNGDSTQSKVVSTNPIFDAKDITLEGNIEGNVEDLFQEGGNVTLKPTDESKPISEENPAVISLDMKEPVKMEQIRLDTGITHTLEEVYVDVEDEDGNVETYHATSNTLETVHYFTDKASADTIVVDLKGQVAVKKVTIRVTAAKGNSLADITEVEFLNNVYDEVPAPVISIVKNIKVKIGSEEATINWDNMANVTGYEVLVEELEKNTATEENQVVDSTIYQTTYNTYDVADLENYTPYQVKVRGVNGDWKGAWSDATSFSPEPTRLPPKPDMVNLKPAASGIDISYKDMDDTKYYKIFYRKVGESKYQMIDKVFGTSYKLRGLEEGVTYEVYVVGVNHLGEGAPSDLATSNTLVNDLPDVTKHSLINTSNGVGEVTNHIVKVEYKQNQYKSSEFALVDNDKNTFWQHDSWDTGGFNSNNPIGPTFTFDKEYKIDHIFVVPTVDTSAMTYVSIVYDDHGTSKKIGGGYSLTTRKLTSPNGQIYFRIDFEPITTSKIQLSLANATANGNISMREVKFYQYHPLEDKVGDLFQDDLRVELKEGIQEEDIAALEVEANTIDEASGEYHPNRQSILSDLNYARQILNDTAIQDTIIVDQNISTSRNNHLGFSSLSDLQPLGVVARPGEQITVYVGTTGNVIPQLVFTQYYAEAGTWKQTVTNLKKGRNVIDVPKIGNMATERGGSVYVRYPNKTAGKDDIKVRVSGGTRIPVLDIHTMTDEVEIRKAIQSYIVSLRDYVAALPGEYEKQGLEFNKNTSVLNSTEIVTKNGLFSMAATAAYDGIKAELSNPDDQVTRLYDSLQAFEEMMGIFYRHKGLSETPEDPIDQTPASRINIRLMRMFDGAFMYASGDHIGIEYGSLNGLVQGKPNQIVNGQMTTTGYFGWGISHEIGHQINQGSLAHAEVTNNVFALLAQTSDDVSKARIEDKFDKIYQKVTSGTIGKGSDVFVTLAMYWQLHIAYDENKTFSDTDSIFARINKISRRSNLSGYTKDELLAIYASEAAGKDLTSFFEHWGLVIGEDAKRHIASLELEEESRPIWYLNVEARRYKLAKKAPVSESTTVSATLKSVDTKNKRYTLDFKVSGERDAIMGYEIKRNGVPIMFTTEDTFIDIIGSLNNRAVTYEVTAYDYYLNPTNTYKLDEVKVAHDGSVAKDNFDISSNFKQTGEAIDHEDPDMDFEVLAVNNLIDDDEETFFQGVERVSNDKEYPYVVINMNSKMDIVGIKYQAIAQDENTIQEYEIYVSQTGEDNSWTLAKTGSFDLTDENHYTNIVYFDKEGTTGGNQLWTYSDVSYVKIVAVGNAGISGKELDVIAPPGDNVELSNSTIGILESDYSYMVDGEEKPSVIPAGSVIFKGEYRGNPAFNVVLLVDAEDSSIRFDGVNFLFASLNSDGDVYEIASGDWLYVVTKEEYEKMREHNIRAELYRVDNALTNDGERLTSTSLSVSNLPNYNELPNLQIVDSTKGE